MVGKPYLPNSWLSEAVRERLVPAVLILQQDFSVPLPSRTGLVQAPFQAQPGSTMVLIQAVGGGGVKGDHGGDGKPGAGGEGCQMAYGTFNIKAGDIFAIRLGLGGSAVPFGSTDTVANGGETSVTFPGGSLTAPGAFGGNKFPPPPGSGYAASQPGGDKDHYSAGGTPSVTGFSGGAGGWASGG